MKTVITHNGSFHTDDVFAVAALQLHLGHSEVEIVRTRDEELIAKGDWVVDVGGVYDPASNRFDHHQGDAPVRENGIPYAAFGLVWQHIGELLCASATVAQRIEEKLAQPIDAGDNGVSLYALNELQTPPFELYNLIGLFSPTWGSGGDKDAAFLAAVDWARAVLQQVIDHQKAIEAMDVLVDEVYKAAENKKVLIFDVPVSAVAAVKYPEVEVVITPDAIENPEKWSATAVRKELSGFASRVLFPESWASLRDQELQTISSISDAIFCHKNRFMFVAQSKEGAVQAAGQVIEN